ncbi:MAG: serine/threonine-protein kinase [Myxococcota bacterium]
MLEEGAQVGAYTLEAAVGEGRFRARHRAEATSHLVRIFRTGSRIDASTRRRFVEEGQYLARLEHPALVRVVDVVAEGNVAALVFESVEGRSLVEVLTEQALDPRSAADLALQLIAGLAHAHHAGVADGHLVPADVLLVEPSPGHVPFVKLLDVGLAKVTMALEMPVPHDVLYLSPEQVDDEATLGDPRSDVFRVGAMLFEMVARVRPFQGSSEEETRRRIEAAERPLVPAVAGPLAPVIERALQREPADRYPSLESMADALRPIASPAVRARVDAWRDAGSLVADGLARGIESASSAGFDPQLVRRLGWLQLGSGTLNLTVLATLQCLGASFIAPSFCFASILVGVGLAEVASGIRAVMFRDGGWLRAAAWLEVLSILGLGVISSIVGAIVLYLGRRRALPEV